MPGGPVAPRCGSVAGRHNCGTQAPIEAESEEDSGTNFIPPPELRGSLPLPRSGLPEILENTRRVKYDYARPEAL